MDLQLYLVEAFSRWRPEAPSVVERTKCYVTLNWLQDGHFQFISDQLLYRLERNNKIPKWTVEYSGGKTTKLVDNLAPRHPYRFRLKVILKATAVPTLAEKALKHFGDETSVFDKMGVLFNACDLKVNETKKKVEDSKNVCDDRIQISVIDEMGEETFLNDEDEMFVQKSKPPRSVDKKNWLESQWSEETWTSTDTDGTSAVCFCMAVRCGYIKQVQLMLEERPSLIGIVNTTNGFTPLATAVRKGDINTVKFLLSAGAEVEQPSSTGQTPLHVAVLAGNTAIVELLLDRGADFKTRDLNGLQAEHYAVDSCSLPMLKLILDRGGDVDARDNNGWTPLFRALCQGARTEIVEELVTRGSDVNMRDNAGLPINSVARLLKNRHGHSRDSILRLVDSQYPHEKALANFTRLTKKIYNVHTIMK